MSVSNSAPLSVLANQAQVRTTIAAEVIKQNANSERAVANLVEESAQNLKKVSSNTGPGVGGRIDKLA